MSPNRSILFVIRFSSSSIAVFSLQRGTKGVPGGLPMGVFRPTCNWHTAEKMDRLGVARSVWWLAFCPGLRGPSLRPRGPDLTRSH